jgi:RNA polymerase sigma-70 factor (ECF subfamily)
MERMDDREIIRRAQAGDRHAFGALFDAYYPCVYRYLNERLGGAPEAEDLCQEVFLSVLSSIDEYPCGGPLGFDEWLLRVAHRLLSEHQHEHKRTRQLQRVRPQETAITLQRLNPAAVALLSKEQRQIVTYRFNAGLSVRETAAALQLESGAVRRLQRAALQTWLKHAPDVEDVSDPD